MRNAKSEEEIQRELFIGAMEGINSIKLIVRRETLRIPLVTDTHATSVRKPLDNDDG